MSVKHSQCVKRKVPLFSLGHVVATPAMLTLLEKHGIDAHEYLDRHVCGDWGDVPSEDAVENDISLKNGFRLLSSYVAGAETIWVITEADRSVTTLLFPREY